MADLWYGQRTRGSAWSDLQREFEQYQDRILFGTDMGADLKTYQIYYRFLETDDEYFDYGTGATPAQGRWRIYGINLPDDILEKIYYKNAVKLFNLDQWF